MDEDVGAIETLDLDRLAYEAVGQGELNRALLYFDELSRRYPEIARLHYMRGLAQKYLRQWPESLRHNLMSQSLQDEFDEASAWNAGIAATAIRDWDVARDQWAKCGIALPGEDGPIETDFGVVSIRLNAWGDGETLFATRIDPVRARLLNIPLPESGYCFDDIVLHDGAATGQRNLQGEIVPVFNALERWEPSLFQTFTAFVTCTDQYNLAPLLASRAPGVAHLEDWTESLAYICLKCSYGLPHRHDHEQAQADWKASRYVGIAAQSRHSVEKILAEWQAGGEQRFVDAVETRTFPVPAPADGHVWWRAPDEGGD